jgi:hypothetical protein
MNEGSALRTTAEKLRKRYARKFAIPISLVTLDYIRHADGREDARIKGPGDLDTVWTVHPCNKKGCCS